MFLASSCERGSNEAYVDFGKIEKTKRLPAMYYDCLFSLPRLNRGPARQTVPSQKEHLVWQEKEGPSREHLARFPLGPFQRIWANMFQEKCPEFTRIHVY